MTASDRARTVRIITSAASPMRAARSSTMALLAVAVLVATLAAAVMAANSSGGDGLTVEETFDLAGSVLVHALAVGSLCAAALVLMARRPVTGFVLGAVAWVVAAANPLLWLGSGAGPMVVKGVVVLGCMAEVALHGQAARLAPLIDGSRVEVSHR